MLIYKILVHIYNINSYIFKNCPKLIIVHLNNIIHHNMLYLHLIDLLESKGINRPLPFLVKNGFTYHTAHNLLNYRIRSISFDHLE